MSQIQRLTNCQLFEIRKNIKAYHKRLRSEIETEWHSRNLTDQDFPVTEFEQAMQIKLSEPLAWRWRMLVMGLPFGFFIHFVVAAMILDRGFRRKFEDYYRFMALGFGLWTGIVVFVAVIF
jgi:hypothetical protein